ncbi:MAG: phage terminase large subunit family protein [Spirochaetales bacterium]|nr:phage terminase large subunit family protein [Spirochaetales bacterium]
MTSEEKAQGLERVRSYLEGSKSLVDWAFARRLIDGRPFDFEAHRYLEGIYRDESPYVVIRKAAQMGASEYAISRALHFAITRGGRTIYYFPTDNDVGEFSRDRFGPAITRSEYLSALVKDTDTAGLKQIGEGSVYFRGTGSRTRMKSVPADFLIFDELDEMVPANVELARKRLGHSSYGWELYISTPSFPGYGIDLTFEHTDQRHWLLRCPGCSSWHCLEDEFLEAHGSPQDPRAEIVFVKGEPGREAIVCTDCGHALDPAEGAWVAKRPREARRGYAVSKFTSTVLSQQDRSRGALTKPAALLRLWRETQFPGEFYNSELGLPYLDAEGGLVEQELQALVGGYPLMASGQDCVMGVDQGNGLHIVVKEPKDKGYAVTVYVHHEPMTDAIFSHLDHMMDDFDVRACVIDALPNTHAARAFARRFRGRVWLSYYTNQKGKVAWGFDAENTPIVNVNRTEALDAWRDLHKQAKRRIPRIEGQVTAYVKQMTNILRSIEEDPVTGAKRATWIKRGPDHFAHADSYAELALGRRGAFMATATVLG